MNQREGTSVGVIGLYPPGGGNGSSLARSLMVTRFARPRQAEAHAPV